MWIVRYINMYYYYIYNRCVIYTWAAYNKSSRFDTTNAFINLRVIIIHGWHFSSTIGMNILESHSIPAITDPAIKVLSTRMYYCQVAPLRVKRELSRVRRHAVGCSGSGSLVSDPRDDPSIDDTSLQDHYLSYTMWPCKRSHPTHKYPRDMTEDQLINMKKKNHIQKFTETF